MWPDTYHAVKCLYRSHSRNVFVARRNADGKAVVLKTFEAGEQGLALARYEFDALSACNHPGLPAALDLDLTCEYPCVVLEFRSGSSLREWVGSNGVPSIEVALELAIAWADALAAIHKARLVHRDISANNLLVDPETGAACIVDFGIAQFLGDRGQRYHEIGSSGVAGTLQFMAPEQTGRLSRGCGFQSDLYAFGGSLYFMLTGKPPFPFSDPLELINAHIARQPVPPSMLRSEIPDPLSRLVLKLLEKEPEDRYASAVALRSDLAGLRDQLIRHGTIDDEFELEAIGIPDRPRFSTKLYGRENEFAELWALVGESVREGPCVCFLEGPAGAGKSRLVDALRSRVSELGAYLVHGSCDDRNDRPYGGWVSVIESLALQILVESDARLEEWRRQLRTALGAIAGAVLELTPDLRPVLGDVAPVADLGPRETRARLVLAVQRMLTVVGTKEHPLIVFLDDFHLSDSASRFLLEELFSVKSNAAITLIVSARSDASETASLIHSARRRLDQLEVPNHRIELTALDSESLVEMLEETLGRPREQVVPLASLVERKTGGNPLCVRQLVDHLHSHDLLSFVPRDGWVWDLGAIAGSDVPEGAIPLLISKLDSLRPELRSLLGWASCAAAGLRRELLEHLGEGDLDSVSESLLELERLGLLLPSPNGYRFAHERIRAAAARLLTDDERSLLHARVAMWRLERVSASGPDLTDDGFELAQHLLQAADRLPPELRLTRIRCCLQAGRQALRSGAGLEARTYLDGARAAFEEPDWVEHPALGLEVWLTSAESAFLASAPSEALELLDAAQPRTRSALEFAQVEMQRLQLMALRVPPAETVAHGLQMLRRLGIRWPQHPSPLRVRFAMYRQMRRIRARAQLGAAAPPGNPRPEHLAALMIIQGLGGTMIREDVYLTVLATTFAVEEPLPAPMSSREAYSISNFGVWLQLLWGDSKRAIEIASAAHVWAQDCKDPVYLPRLELAVRAGLHPFVMRRRRALAGLAACSDRLMENGDIEFAYYARFLKAVLGGLAGEGVGSVESQLQGLSELVERSAFTYHEPSSCLQAWRWLCDGALPESDLAQAVSRASDRQRSGDVGVRSYEVSLWLLVCCVYGRPDLAWTESQKIMPELFRKAPYVQVLHVLFYRAIAGASLDFKRSRLGARRQLKRTIRWIDRRAYSGPDFPHMVVFLRAECARLAGRREQAHRFYEQAARGALEQDYLHHAALAKERRASLLLDARRITESRDVLHQALQFYERWGATPKANLLREELSRAKR